MIRELHSLSQTTWVSEIEKPSFDSKDKKKVEELKEKTISWFEEQTTDIFHNLYGFEFNELTKGKKKKKKSDEEEEKTIFGTDIFLPFPQCKKLSFIAFSLLRDKAKKNLEAGDGYSDVRDAVLKILNAVYESISNEISAFITSNENDLKEIQGCIYSAIDEPFDQITVNENGNSGISLKKSKIPDSTIKITKKNDLDSSLLFFSFS